MPKEIKRHAVRRKPKRANYDREMINQIIDESLVCHVGIMNAEQPFVIPTIHARKDEHLLFHGLKGGRLLEHIRSGKELCVAITIADGLVLARSALHHSMSYRSVVLFGTGTLIKNEQEKLEALRTISEHIIPGRWKDVRPPNDKELKMTSVVSMSIVDASAKIRDAIPNDDYEDYALPVWAGFIPLKLQALTPVADPQVIKDIKTPEYAVNYERGIRSTRT